MLDPQSLYNAQKRLPDNPLERRGIGKDWVCVIHPSLVDGLMLAWSATFKQPIWEISQVTGRMTFIMNSAPIDKLQFMPLEQFFIQYRDELRAKACLAAINDAERLRRETLRRWFGERGERWIFRLVVFSRRIRRRLGLN